MEEKELETCLYELIRAGHDDRSGLASLAFNRSTSDAKSLRELVGSMPYELFKDTSDWNLHPRFMTEVAGQMTPDIVIRSRSSGQNRIYIEVKKKQPLNYGEADSQIVRYLLHLLATTESKPSRSANDIRRAIVVAAPAAWFKTPKNAQTWGYFLTTYKLLASSFDVTLAEIYLSDT